MKNLKFTITGKNDIRLNNPQSADPLNKYAIDMKKYTNVHSSRRDEQHYINQRILEMKSKLYWNDIIGVYIPTSWIMESIAKESFAQVKLAKAKMRSAVFVSGDKIKLNYNGMETVSKFDDIVLGSRFRVDQLIKQGQVKIVKAFPQFTGWSIDVELDFDERILTEDEMKTILSVAVKRNGFGDFRPTYGTGSITSWSCTDEAETA